MRIQRLLAWMLSGVWILSLFVPPWALLARAADYADWAATHNRERYRGTALTAIEKALYTAPAEGVPSAVEDTARKITTGVKGDLARLAAIYDWVTANIAYDYDYYEGRSYTTGESAGEVLELGRAVCVGYAELTAQLCRAVGIPCKSVGGYTLASGESWGEEHKGLKSWETNHAWNEAYVEGRWVILDTTWGCGNAYREGVVTTGPSTREQFDLTPEKLADSRLNLDYLSDGIFLYDQAADDSLTVKEPLDKTLTKADIPAAASGRPVVAVGNSAFEGCSSLTRVTLPSSVSALGDRAFAYTALQSVPDLTHVTKPGSSLFAYCAALTAATLPAHWQEIPRGIFNKCANLESVALPPVITAVGAQAFNGCEKITAFPFKDGLKTVGKEAFAGTGLTEAHLPDSVTTLGDGAFARCDALKEVTLSAGLTAIPSELFAWSSNLSTVDIPAGVKTIGREAFRRTDITAVTIPAGVTVLGNGAFSECGKLKTVSLPASLQMIGENAFNGCGIEEIDLPAALRIIGDTAFAQCGALKELTLPEGLEQIGRGAFQRCGKLERLHIPASVKTIGEEVLAYCTDVAAVTVAEGNTSFEVKEGALYATGEPYTLLYYPPAHPGTTFRVPAEVKKIGSMAFAYNRYLEELYFDGVIGQWGGALFSNAASLRVVHIADGNTTVPGNLFRNCGALEEVTLPEGLTYLRLDMFSGCGALKELRVPASVTEIDIWGRDAHTLPALERLSVAEDNATYYDVDGVMFHRETGALVCYPAGKTETRYMLPAGTPEISEYAFAGVTHLTEVVLPAGLKHIGNCAFEGCENLATINFPEGLETIEHGAFHYAKLSDISLPASVTQVGWAFHLTSWWDALPNGPVYLGDILYGIKWSDEEWYEVDEIVVREGTRLITNSFISLCQQVKRLEIPASVTVINRDDDDYQNWGLVIAGYRGTAAEEFAKSCWLTFADLEGGALGDVDGDGNITTTDARLTLQYAVGKVDTAALFLDVADVDGDGAYTTTDARLILQYSVGKIDAFQVPKT